MVIQYIINIVLLCDQEPGGPGRRGVVEQPAGGPGLHLHRDLDRHKQVLCKPCTAPEDSPQWGEELQVSELSEGFL